MYSRCLKITEKVSFNIASEASYIYILSGQKFIKMPKMVNLASFWKPEVFGQTVLPDTSILKGQKLVENVKCDILGDFQTLWKRWVLDPKLAWTPCIFKLRLMTTTQKHFNCRLKYTIYCFTRGCRFVPKIVTFAVNVCKQWNDFRVALL